MVRSLMRLYIFTLNALGHGNINSIEGSGSDFWHVRGSNILEAQMAVISGILHILLNNSVAFRIPNNTSDCLTGWAVGYPNLK
jgi:hypothetical protein